MRQIFINDYSLNEADIDFEVIRVKGLIINSRGEVLIARNNNTYQFPGGHKEEDESLDASLVREIKEETGIDVELEDGPFLEIVTYDNNYFGTNQKVCNKIYYYRIFSDQAPNFFETSYDELECQTDFELFYIKIQDLEKFLHKSLDDGSIDVKIGREMLLVFREYSNLFGGM